MIEYTQSILARQIPDLGGKFFGFVPGNCVQTAFAALLDLPVEAVPHFALVEGYRAWIKEWLETERGKRIRIYTDNERAIASWAAGGVDVAPADHRPSSQLVVAGGISPRGFMHVVLWRGDTLVWDVHPDKTGILAADEYWQVTDL